jgi:hypothetical protein
MKRLNKNNDVHITFDWAELTNLYRQVVANPSLAKHIGLKQLVGPNGQWETEKQWVGSTSQEMLKWLDNGYEFESKVDPDSLPAVAYDRPRMRYTDDPEGEFNYDLYVQGETEHFLTKPKRKMLGGIRINFRYDFSAGVASKTITDYGQWIGSVIQNLQAKGYDLEISIYNQREEMYPSKPDIEYAFYYVKVSKFGERVMPFDWSSAFAPGGFRHLLFLANTWPDNVYPDLVCERNLGRPTLDKWDITWNPTEREIHITCNPRGGGFPMEDMTKRFESWTE